MAKNQGGKGGNGNDTANGGNGDDKTPPAAVETQFPRKITLKDCGAQPTREDKAAMLMDPKTKIELLRVYGVAATCKPGSTTLANGDVSSFVKFGGQFKAINLRTGEIFQAATMILPRFLEEQMHGALSVPGAQSAEFAFEIGAQGDQPNAKPSATGYTYYAKPLLQMAPNSALAALEGKIGAPKIAALPAPK